jgi:hypothetical protein
MKLNTEGTKDAPFLSQTRARGEQGWLQGFAEVLSKE